MELDSGIIFFLSKIWNYIVRMYKRSLLSFAVERLTARLSAVASASLTKKILFDSFELNTSAEKSLIGRGVLKFLSAIQQISPKIAEWLSQSFFVSFINDSVGDILYLLSKICRNSFVGRFIGGLFLEEFLDVQERKIDLKRTTIFGGFLTIFIIACLLLLSRSNFILLAGGLVGGILVLYRPEIGVLAAVFLIPLVPTKLILGLAAVTVVSFVFHLLAGRLTITFGMIDFFVLIFAAMIVISTIFSYRTSGSLPVAAVYLLYTALFFAAKNMFKNRKLIFAALSLIILSGFIVAGIGIWQNVTNAFENRDMWLDSTMFEDTKARVYSTLENPNVLGEYLIIVISFAVGAVYWYKKPIYKICALGVAGVAGVCLILTYSRGAWLGLLLAAAIFVMLNDKKLVWIGIVGILLAPAILPKSILERFTSIGNVKDTSTNYRLNIWLASLIMLRTFWPIGIGLGEPSFEFVYSHFAFNAVYAPHSHNLFMQILIDMGIVGLLAFLGYIAAFFKGLLKERSKIYQNDKTMEEFPQIEKDGKNIYRSDNFIKIASGALCAAVAGYLLQGMTDNVWYNYRVTCLFWLILAIGGGVAELGKAKA